MPPHSLINLEIQKCYQKEPRFNGVFSRNNLSKIKYWVCVINLMSTYHWIHIIETHWITLYVKGGNLTYFDSFGTLYVNGDNATCFDSFGIG